MKSNPVENIYSCSVYLTLSLSNYKKDEANADSFLATMFFLTFLRTITAITEISEDDLLDMHAIALSGKKDVSPITHYYSSISKPSRDTRFTEILEFYENANCEGIRPPAVYVKRDTCYTVSDKNIQSARIITYWGPSYFTIYDKCCDSSPIIQRVQQDEEEPTDCYKISTGNSFKWSWYGWYF